MLLFVCIHSIGLIYFGVGVERHKGVTRAPNKFRDLLFTFCVIDNSLIISPGIALSARSVSDIARMVADGTHEGRRVNRMPGRNKCDQQNKE